ncbi:hypothetical protein [Streptomyces vilmorinianum]|uniref:hypothetical protein n=1 Tax=Streptomyces vilmorinianum TaxID=3051092 RepID=UPI001586DC6C|nr:hypothetical protein [Streptomyces vilmorinianum]
MGAQRRCSWLGDGTAGAGSMAAARDGGQARPRWGLLTRTTARRGGSKRWRLGG